MSALRGLVAGVVVGIVLGWSAASAGAAIWQPFPLPAPPGGQFATPVGFVGDLSFWAPNRGLMAVAGNASVPEGLYSWDGVGWHQLATVCGSGVDARIAWAGPTEFWTIARPSLPRVPTSGRALCRFRDGEVVGSYSTEPGAGDAYQRVFSAACRVADDCWFGGVAALSNDGTRVGAFHLHWDGTAVHTVYASQGRAVSDLQSFGGGLLASAFAGAKPGERDPAVVDPGGAPVLLQRIADGTFVGEPFVPANPGGIPPDGTELTALDAADGVAWAVGGRATSGPRAGIVRRGPLAARTSLGRAWTELTLNGPALAPDDVFVDVAALPDGGGAWVALRGSTLSQPRLAFVADDGTTTVHELAGIGDPIRGAATRVACPAANDCWAATARGYLYRWSDGASYPQDRDPAFQGTIATRPNEAAEQVIADTPPEDDSLLNAPPIEQPAPPVELPACKVLKSALSRVDVGRARPLGRSAARASSFRLTVRFRLARRARVGLVARRGGRVVARARPRTLRPGRRSMRLTVSRSRWPQRMRFTVKELALPRQRPCSGSRDDGFAIMTAAAPRVAAR